MKVVGQSALLIRSYYGLVAGSCRYSASASASSSVSLSQGIGFRVVDGKVDVSASTYHQRLLENGRLQDEISAAETLALVGGGEKARKRHLSQRKLLVRDRIRKLLDQGREEEWLELGLLCGLNMPYGDIPAAGSVMGIGTIKGQKCMIVGNDATVKGGTIYPITLRKHLRIQEIAEKLHLPCVYLVDSGGAFLPLQSEIFMAGGRTFYNEAIMGSKGIPQIAVVCGNCTAGGAYTPTMTDDIIIVHRIGSLFLGGPPLVKAATGEEISAEDLGGGTVHCTQSGSTDYFAETEDEALSAARDIISIASAETSTLVERVRCDWSHQLDPVYAQSELQGLAGASTNTTNPIVSPLRFAYQILGRVFDRSELFEFRGRYGKGAVTAFGRLGGKLVAILFVTGEGLDFRGAEKASQLVQSAHMRDLPLIIFQNNAAIDQTEGANLNFDNLKAFGMLMSSLATSSSYKTIVNVGNSLGNDYLLFGGGGLSADYSIGWPNSKTDQGIRDEKPTDEENNVNVSSALTAANQMILDTLIPPQKTRNMLMKLLETFPLKPPASARSMSSSDLDPMLKF